MTKRQYNTFADLLSLAAFEGVFADESFVRKQRLGQAGAVAESIGADAFDIWREAHSL